MRIKEDEYRWAVYGEFGGYFTNLSDAKKCAKFASTTDEHDHEAEIYFLADGSWYFEYKNGRCTYDGWTRKK